MYMAPLLAPVASSFSSLHHAALTLAALRCHITFAVSCCPYPRHVALSRRSPGYLLVGLSTSDWLISHGIMSPSTVRNTTHHHRCTDMEGSTTRRPTETWDEIQAGRKCEEARRCAEAGRIRRKQIVRGFEEEICGLRARIMVLRHECEARVAQVQRKWERARAIELGEVAMVEENGEV